MPPETGKSSTRASVLKLGAFAAFVVCCVALTYVPWVRERLTLDGVNAQLGAISEMFNRPYGPILFILLSALILLLHMPGLIMIVVGALIYGAPKAFVYSWIGSVLGTTAMFFVARFGLADYFRPKLETSFLKNIALQFEKNGILLVAFLRLLVFMFPPLNWLLGASSIRTRDYVIGNVIGLAPVVLGVQWTARRLKTIRSTADLFSAETVTVVAIFLAVLIAIAWARRRFLSDSSETKN